MSITLLAGLSQLPPATSASAPEPASGVSLLGDPVGGPRDFAPTGLVEPTAVQRTAARALGAASLTWNAFGTPASILPADGSLGRFAGAGPAAAARAWLSANAAVLGLSPAQVADLQLVNVQELASYRPGEKVAQAVLFQQVFDGLAPARDAQVTVGVRDGDIAYVSSSLTRDAGLAAAAPADTAANAKAAWLTAAADVGRAVTDSALAKVLDSVAGGWTRLGVDGFAQEQQVRLRALPTPGGGVRPVFEANVVDSQGGSALAYTSLVDAVTGKVIARHSQVENHNNTWSFNGSITNTACGPKHSFELADDLTRNLTIVVAGLPADDYVVNLYDRGGELLYKQDLLTSPEVLAYSPGTTIPAGSYSFDVCPFDDASAALGTYAAQVLSSDLATPGSPSPGSLTGNPRWTVFTGVPSMSSTTSATEVPTNTTTLCWTADEGCDDTLANIAATGPWDQLLTAGVPSLTTVGNNANTHEAWLSPLTPGGLAQAPVSPTRDYPGTEFTDAWNNSGCDPAQLVPGGNDVNFVVSNLFSSHNRMHDWSYYLGFTESNYNLQTENMGRGGVPGDAEVGNVQAGAVDSHVVDQSGVVTGRNNANQITLQDGIPGITNQYLFQPLAGAFYAPCTDGSLDMGIVGHEYTHAISNRMVAGPDQGLTSEHAGAMGESWSDLAAAEYMFAHGYDNGGNPFAVGTYATGNTEVAIRDFAIDDNPLNFSDYGFDHMGAEVHADGEIWNATQWSVRQALAEKYDARFPSSDAALQRKCTDATANASPLDPAYCPGNRRWIQLVFDSFLLQANGATSMLGMRDAMLAADQLRFGGANQQAMWRAFAQRGMGVDAAVTDGDDPDPKPSFASPLQPNVTVTVDAPAGGKLYVGRFEARATPVADTIATTTDLTDAVTMVPGTYELLFVSPTHGFQRQVVTLDGRQPARKVSFSSDPNLAAAANGARVIGATEGSLNADHLIDGTEATNWGGVSATSVDETTPGVAVDLSGGEQTVRQVAVSALLRPAVDAEGDDPDPDAVSRFTGLRQFALESCTSACDTAAATWTRFYTSPEDAFPATRPRPVAPNNVMRFFDVPDTRATAVRLVALENQCTGYDGFAGELDNDPVTTTDCKAGSDRDTIVHAAELQVFGSPAHRVSGSGVITGTKGTTMNGRLPATVVAPGPGSTPGTPGTTPGTTTGTSTTTGSTCTDSSAPVTRPAVASKTVSKGRRLRLRGRSTDVGCGGVTAVQVSLRTAGTDTCRFLTAKGTWVTARCATKRWTLTAAGTDRWLLTTPARLRQRGSYVLHVRAVDSAGNVERARKANLVRVRVR